MEEYRVEKKNKVKLCLWELKDAKIYLCGKRLQYNVIMLMLIWYSWYSHSKTGGIYINYSKQYFSNLG